MNHGVSELEIAVLDGDAGEARAKIVGEIGELADGELVAAAVTAKHDACARGQRR
jgi:hypothetical protein